jgi:hypothetical protein
MILPGLGELWVLLIFRKAISRGIASKINRCQRASEVPIRGPKRPKIVQYAAKYRNIPQYY